MTSDSITAEIYEEDIDDSKLLKLIEDYKRHRIISDEDLVFSYNEFLHDRILEVEISYDYTPGSPAIPYMANGDPGEPEEPPEIDITSIVMHTENKKLRYRAAMARKIIRKRLKRVLIKKALKLASTCDQIDMDNYLLWTDEEIVEKVWDTMCHN